MKGLIKKDLFMLMGNWKYILICICIFGFISLDGSQMFYFIPVFICTMLFISTFSYDEYNKWDIYACTLPKGRLQVVRAKYLANLLLVGIAIVVTYALAFIIETTQNNLDISKINELLFGCLFAVILLQSVMYPLIFKFGVEKGRIGLFVGVFGGGLLLGWLMNNVSLPFSNAFIMFLTNHLIPILILTMIVMLIISYQISKHIYLKKEF